MSLVYSSDYNEWIFRDKFGDFCFTINDNGKTVYLPKAYYNFAVLLRSYMKDNCYWEMTGFDPKVSNVDKLDFVPTIGSAIDTEDLSIATFIFIVRPVRLLVKGKKYALEFVMREEKAPHTIKHRFNLNVIYK